MGSDNSQIKVNSQPILNIQSAEEFTPPAPEMPTMETPSSPMPTEMSAAPEMPTTDMNAAPTENSFEAPTSTPINNQPEEKVNQTLNSLMRPSPATPLSAAKSGKRNRKKMFIILGASLTTLIVGGLIFYFGYWTNPSVIWGNALSTTAVSYDKTVGYLNNTTKSNFKGTKLTSAIKINAGDTNYSGSLDLQSDKLNSQASLKIDLSNAGLGLGNIDIEEESIIAPNQTTPDLYLKLGGLGDLLSSFTGTGGNASALDNNWVKINHTEVDGALANALPINTTDTSKPSLTQSELYGAAKDFGTVNSKYVFTTNSKYSVTKIEKKIGFENVDGHKTYHYLVGFNSQNVQSYITAIRDSLDKDALGTYIKAMGSGQTINDFIGYDSLVSSAKNIKDSDNVDIWVDTGTRTIYKIRKSDPANPTTNYIEAGLNFKNFDSFPFFINSQNVSDSITDKIGAQLTIKTKLNTLEFNVTDTSTDSQDSTNNFTASLNGNVQFINTPLNITAPTKTITLKQALTILGLADQYDSLVTPPNSSQNSVLSLVPGANNQLIHLLANAKIKKH